MAPRNEKGHAKGCKSGNLRPSSLIPGRMFCPDCQRNITVNERSESPMETIEEELVVIRTGADGASWKTVARKYIYDKYGKANVEVQSIEHSGERRGGRPVMLVRFALTHQEQEQE